MSSLSLWKYYCWENYLNEKQEWFLLEQNGSHLQFAIFDTEEQVWDGWMIINTHYIQTFTEATQTTPPDSITSPKYSIVKNSLEEICTHSILCEFTGESDEMYTYFGDMCFEDNEFRFFLITPDGTYITDGYLRPQKSQIVSLHYEGWYLKELDNLARNNPQNHHLFL